MKKPEQPPSHEGQLRALLEAGRLDQVMGPAWNYLSQQDYLHWDKVRRLKPPEGFSVEEVWVAAKLQRMGVLKPVPLKDKQGEFFQYCIPDLVLAELHKIDVGAGGAVGVPEPITNPQTRDRYLIWSLMEEAITSSQLEGAATTRVAAKEMIRTKRPPTCLPSSWSSTVTCPHGWTARSVPSERRASAHCGTGSARISGSRNSPLGMEGIKLRSVA